MNENNDFNVNNNVPEEPVVYESYYNHRKRKTPWPALIAIIVVAIIVLIWLWYSGVFTPVDRQAEYTKLNTRACEAAVKYANTNFKDAKEVSGKIVYVTVGNLINANLIEAELKNYLTDEPIPSSTDLRLEVLPNGTFRCHGFVDPSDDTEKPVITLKGDATITASVGQTLTDPGAIAIDNMDGDISENIERSGNVNSNLPGTYIVNYIVSDRSGNLADVVKRTYIIQ
jgi:hypothetical protein